MFFPYSLLAESICLFFAFLYLSKDRHNYWGAFRWFMLCTVVVEGLGHYLLSIEKNNHGLFNLYLPVEVLFKLFILYKLCNGYFKVSYLVAAVLMLFTGFYLYESLGSGFTKYSHISNNVASIGILGICCSYYYSFLKKEEYVNIYEHSPFWIICGLFFFYLGGTACNVFYKFLSQIWLESHIPIRFIIYTFLNFIFYGCWSYAFVCRSRETILSS